MNKLRRGSSPGAREIDLEDESEQRAMARNAPAPASSSRPPPREMLPPGEKRGPNSPPPPEDMPPGEVSSYTGSGSMWDDVKSAGGAVRKKRKAGGQVEGDKARPRLDRPGRKAGGGNWVAGAIKHPGALHRQLGVPEGQKIPEKKLAAASHSDNPTLARRANLAKTLKKMH